MEKRLEGFLSYCSKMDFGPVNLTEREKEFYRAFNNENILLCISMPDSIKKEALLFLKRYSGISADQELDFFKNYYAPAWTIIYWLRDFAHGNNDLSKEDINDAITAHSMAMSLHSMDDHLNDREIPISHLTLLLRSQSWMMMNTALNCLAARVEGGREIVENFINDYYSSICGQEAVESLDSYCDLFRKQMATWMIVPVLLTKIMKADEGFTNAVQTAYGSFGIAWRLLDDIQDVEKDLMRGTHTAIYICLPENIKYLWDKIPGEKSSKKSDYSSGILDYIIENRIVDRLKEKACNEMETAASIAQNCNLKGLADEFRCLARPLKTNCVDFINGNVEDRSRAHIHRKTLSIEVTTHCNSACLHCFVRASITKPSSLPLNVVKDIIAEGHSLDYRNLHITGGEPLLWEGLFDALDYAFELGYESVFLNSNGTLLTDNIAGRLGSYKGLKISVSLEGREPLHDRVRGKSSHRRALQGIEKALDAGIDLCIFTTVCKSLLAYLSYFVDEVYERFPGINNLTLVQLIRVKNDVFALSNEFLDPDDFIKLVQAASLLNVFGYKTIILNNPLSAVTSKLLEIWGIPKSSPLHRNGDLIVLASQKVAPAHSTHNDFGRYEPGMIENVLSSNEYQSAVSPDDTTCPTCTHLRLCRENGMIRPSKWYRDMRSDVPYCRRVLERAKLYV